MAALHQDMPDPKYIEQGLEELTVEMMEVLRNELFGVSDTEAAHREHLHRIADCLGKRH
jgi:hypothetical protein